MTGGRMAMVAWLLAACALGFALGGWAQDSVRSFDLAKVLVVAAATCAVLSLRDL